ncbi:MAG TPA: DUF488 domain-containing protein [Rhizomicrobium sp.]|nr:DUF488 domain-containing protein [Rhizomicrobium sp.]
MRSLVLKRAYDPPSPKDGTRILVDRLWPRGVSKAKAGLDGWNKDIAPSPGLRKWFGHRPERFREFAKRYRAELKHNPAANDLRALKGKVTLVYGARDPGINHAVVLAKFLKS